MVMSSSPCSAAKRSSSGRRAIVRLVLADHLAQHAGRVEAGQAGQVDGGLGVAGPLEHAALAVAQREDVAGPGQVDGAGGGVDEGGDGGGPVGGRDAGGGAVAGVDRDGEGGAVATRCCRRTIGGSSSSSRRSPIIGMQITPDVWFRKKAIFSGVANSAAMMRSPSFSRSASSTTTTISPRPKAATASSMAANGTAAQLVLSQRTALDVLGDQVELEVHPVARAGGPRAW